jgi:hypothetical protein
MPLRLKLDYFLTATARALVQRSSHIRSETYTSTLAGFHIPGALQMFIAHVIQTLYLICMCRLTQGIRSVRPDTKYHTTRASRRTRSSVKINSIAT